MNKFNIGDAVQHIDYTVDDVVHEIEVIHPDGALWFVESTMWHNPSKWEIVTRAPTTCGGDARGTNPLDTQVGGDHYKGRGIQPVEYIMSNQLGYFEGNIVKYITRWKQKGGYADIDKVIHYCELLKWLHKKYEGERLGEDNQKHAVGEFVEFTS